MMPVTKDNVMILIEVPEDEKKETRFSQPSFVKACGGNERKAALLDHFVYGACKKIRDQKLPKDCKVVTLTRTHEQIFGNVSIKMSRKSLIRYLDEFNVRNMVENQPYQRTFTVHLDVIQDAIDNPPQPNPRKPRKPRSTKQDKKDVNVTTLQPSEDDETVEMLREKVDMLQLKVDNLQRESGHVTTLSGQLTTLQRAFSELLEQVEGLKNSAPLITCNLLPLDASNDSVSACAEYTHISFSSFTDEDIHCISVEDVLAYQTTCLSEEEANDQLSTKPASMPTSTVDNPQEQTKEVEANTDRIDKEATKKLPANVTPLFNTDKEQDQVDENPKGKGRKGKKAAQEQDDVVLTEEEKAQQEAYAKRRSSLQKQINERRGGPLRTAGKCINETNSLNDLVREFDDYQITAIWKFLATEHWKYKKCPTIIGGHEILEESRPTWSLIKDRPEHRQYNVTGKTPSKDSQQPTKLIAATPGSQYIVDELQSRYEDNFNAWLATPEGQACMAEAEQNELACLAAGGR